VRIALVDPPAITPPYERALASALASAGADVELITSRWRYGELAEPTGYRVRELFYPLSGRRPAPSAAPAPASGPSRPRLLKPRARIGVKSLEHPFGLARLATVRADVVHLHWSIFPEVDQWFLRARAPLVFTAHNLVHRNTAHKRRSWQRLLERFERVIVHTESGRATLARFGVDDAKLRVIPHPVFRGKVDRRDDAHTALALGFIQPYKNLGASIEAVRRVPGLRLVVAGHALEPLDAYIAASGDVATWRIGYQTDEEIADALARSTVALFPYKTEIDQSGALLQALGAGVPAVVYDVGGLADPVRAYGAGRVVPAGDLDAFVRAIEDLVSDPSALAAAREGAERARAELTWEACAVAHLAVYAELV
jgi:glycosyltransferase involved in cell wall biosynthesis